LLFPSYLLFFLQCYLDHPSLPSFPTRRSSDLCILSGTAHQSLAESDNILCLNFYLAPGCYDVRSLIADLQRRWCCGQSLDTPSVDRKSTRLNSSHQIISYAVFCLKKKKYTNNI